jgi:hypothetical protein
MMVSYDNSGKKISEINVIIRPDGGTITSHTVYSGERIITQNISTRDNAGNVKTETIYGGKILP